MNPNATTRRAWIEKRPGEPSSPDQTSRGAHDPSPTVLAPRAHDGSPPPVVRRYRNPVPYRKNPLVLESSDYDELVEQLMSDLRPPNVLAEELVRLKAIPPYQLGEAGPGAH